MTLRQFFGVSSAVSGSKDDSEPEPEDSDSDFLEPPSPKQQCPSSSSFQHEQLQRRAVLFPADVNIIKNGKRNFLGWSTMKTFKELSASFAEKEEGHMAKQEERGSQSHSIIGKRQ